MLDGTIIYVLNATRKHAVGIERSMLRTLEKVRLETILKHAKIVLRKKKGLSVSKSTLNERSKYLGIRLKDKIAEELEAKFH